MKRALFWSLGCLCVLLVGAVSTVLMRADFTELPPPDPAMPILLSDGTTRPLSEVLELARTSGLPVAEPMKISIAPVNENIPEAERAAQEQRLRELTAAIERSVRQEESSIFRLAEDARRAGRLDQAEALYLSIPEGDPRYARARRRLAWNVLTKGRDQPHRAVAYVQQSVMADPLNGNAWHDMVRVYGATLGLDLD